MEIETIKVVLEGLADIMFDPFTGQEKDTKPPEQKFYFTEGNQVMLPAENIYAFLFSENPAGCAKSFEGKRGKAYLRMGQAHIIIEPTLIPFTRNGQSLIFKEFDDETFYVSKYAPRTKLGSLSIKQNVKLRPVIRLPWSLSFQIKLVENPLIDETKLYNWFQQGGILVALGTYRPRFGRFTMKIIK